MAKTQICDYCATANPLASNLCLACGAPLPAGDRNHNSSMPTHPLRTDSLRIEMEPDQLSQIIRNVDNSVGKGWQFYGIFWRTLGEAIAIAFSSFVLGVLGKATGMAVGGVLVSLLVGYLVGRNTRSFYTISAGIITAVILGIFAGLPFWVLGWGPKGIFFTASGLTLFAALGASYKAPRLTQANWWDKLRPIIGVLGGLCFALLGSGLTWAVLMLINIVTRWVSQFAVG